MSIRALLLDFTVGIVYISVHCVGGVHEYNSLSLTQEAAMEQIGLDVALSSSLSVSSQSPVIVSSWPCNMSLYHVHHGTL